MTHITIGELAKRAGVHLETIRYYERRGLIAEPPRNKAGYRLYSILDIEHIRWIRQAQGIGFSLEEIRYLMSLRMGEVWTEAELRQHAEEKIMDIENKIKQLEEMKALLIRTVGQSNESHMSCPVLLTITKGGEAHEQEN
ncbi:MerR family transcriptional regulator [Paenibacillus solani]|uniref:HTH merR-type domain-containing protein n=1 Tax=Paenibacillus solani TaxID=1705565 RepID=A0A0M1P554_9BACL|nr:MerR family transcriptional regulator [Paenibacillus solani]KOR89174.1 hypothetical protein AM231_08365 [Paenibacillus solani]